MGLAVAVLLAVAVAPAIWVMALRRDANAAEAFAASLRQPILNEPAGSIVTVEMEIARVERAPEALVRPVIDRRLSVELAPVVASWPDPYCLDVHIDGRQVFSAGDGPQIPASVEKVITAAAALALLPAEERFVTTVLADGDVVDGRLEGNLWVVGGGDPLITTEPYSAAYRRQPQLRTPFEDLADEIAALGIERVEGRLVGDDSRYDDERYVASWPDRYRAQHNSGPLSALTVNDGFTEWDPRRVDAVDPARHFTDELRQLLRERGVVVAGGTGVGRVPGDATFVAELVSPPVVDIVQQMLRESDNNTAELLLKELALRETGVGATLAGAEVATQVVQRLVMDEQPPIVADGSGLDRGNLVTCSLLTALLDHFGPVSDLGGGLPVANQTGTLAHRFEDDPAAGRLAAKTGLLNNVNALAGFVTNDDGLVTFAQILNGIPLTGGLGTEIQEELVAVLLRHPGSLDAEDVFRE